MLGKKKKKKTKPFYTKGWFTISAVAAVLAGLGYFLWFTFMKPESAESLYTKAEKAMKQLIDLPEKDITPEQIKELREARDDRDGPLANFLRFYPEDANAKKIHEWSDQVDRIVIKRYLYRFRKNAPAKSDAEQVARDALDLEDEGNLAGARAKWKELLKYKDDKDPELRPWALLADEFMKNYDFVDRMYKDMRARIAKETAAKPAEVGSPAEDLALKAIRLESKEPPDLPEASKTWGDLKKMSRDNGDLRTSYLLASKRMYEIDQRRNAKKN